MAKRNRKRPFETHTTSDTPSRDSNERFIDRDRGIFGFFRDFGTRETIESVIVAVVLALMFRAYEAEAFIIPTGSMAPTLQGQHMDVVCEQCKYQYRTQAQDGSNSPPERRMTVTTTYCPICRYDMRMSQNNPDHSSNHGDRILVNKFVYDFAEPERFDVIVFKNPNNGKQNYIKRLVGLPGDNLYVENGDLYNVADTSNPHGIREIIRKPPEKVEVMLQLVDDTNHLPKKLQQAGWPRRWDCRDKSNNTWTAVSSGDKSVYQIQPSDQLEWLRYRHLIPHVWQIDHLGILNTQASEWESIKKGEVPKRAQVSKGELIRDYYEYNEATFTRRRQKLHQPSMAAHWVGDLAVECEIEIESSGGIVALDLVEGGSHFTCEIDVSTGKATLSCKNDTTVVFDDMSSGTLPTGTTAVRGPGTYTFRYAHVDDQLCLWVDNKLTAFDSSTYVRGSEVVPKYSPEDPGDAEPAGIGCKGVKGKVTRLKMMRDVYYTSATAGETNISEDKPGFRIGDYKPTDWSDPKFLGRLRSMRTGNNRVYKLDDGQYFPMGDNSPSSLDARVWPGEKYVSEDMLIGRAMFIYWPHSLNRPIKYFPNFKRMGFIK